MPHDTRGAGFPTVPGVAIAHDFVEAAGLRFHVAEAGDGEPLLMLHGWPQHWYMWRHVMPRLAKRYRVIAVDLRGFGWSDAPAGGYEKETLAADVLAVMDAMDLDRVRLMGHDWGGYIGFLLCLFHPERFERYMPLNIVHPWIRMDPKRTSAIPRSVYQWVLASPAGAWMLRTQPGIVERGLLTATYNKQTWSRDELVAFSTVLQEPARANASVQLYRTFLTREAIPLVTGRYRGYRLTTPTRLVFGKRDPAIDFEMLAGYEPYADEMTVEIVDDASHFIVDECPDLVADEAEAFFV